MSKYAHSSLIRAYTVDFKREALRMLSTGRTLREVTNLMGVSISTLTRWKGEEVARNQPDNSRIPVGKRRVYDTSIKEKALQQIQAGQSIGVLSKTMNVPTHILYNWQHNAQVISDFPTSSDRSTSQRQGAAILRRPSGVPTPGVPLPPVLEKTPELDITPLRKQATVSMQRITRKRYDEEFKQRAIKKLVAGRRMDKVAKGMGVPENTLRKWLSHQDVGGESNSLPL